MAASTSSSHLRPSQVIVKKCGNVSLSALLGPVMSAMGFLSGSVGEGGQHPVCVAFTGNWPTGSCCFTPLTNRKEEMEGR